MADVEEPQFTSLAERIAALNKQKNFQAPPPKAKRAPPPPPPNRSASQLAAVPSVPSVPISPANAALRKSPTIPARPSAQEAPPPLPRRTTVAVVGAEDETPPPLPSRNLAPPLPTRRPSQQTSPSLPPRRPSAQQLSARRNSNESEISYVSTASALSLNHASSVTSQGSVDTQPRKLPPTLDQARLPPLPPTRRELEARAKEAAAKEAASAVTARVKAPLVSSRPSPAVPRAAAEDGPRSALPPRLPSRPVRPQQAEDSDEPPPALPARRLPPRPTSYAQPRSAIENGLGSLKKQWRGQPHEGEPTPPPVPLASRPSLAQIGAAASRTPPAASQDEECLICRDFSGPDTVAARCPIASLPRNDPVGYLAHMLCDPFPSPTDKARAIFTWCHHNIAYDVDGFFGGCIPRGQTPEQSIFSGKAVCEGYAKIYQSIAQRAGLDCVLVGGHGKGFGFSPLKPGERPPPRNATGHAWNAVRIDGGEWKLLDACWGAGNVCDKRAERYEKKFNPDMFTMDNDQFGRRHFPEDSRYFFRSDGRALPWEEYIVEPTKGERATLYTNARDEGISEETFEPQDKHVPVQPGDRLVRFQFGKLCPHWTYERHGGGKKPYLLMMKVHGPGGTKDDLVPMEYDGFWWWADIPARELGRPGQDIFCYALDTLDGRNARGVSKAEFLAKKGRCGMSWVGVATWVLV